MMEFLNVFFEPLLLLLQTSLLALTLCLLALGLLVGSFLNVVIYRLPVMMQKAWEQEAADILGQGTAAQTQMQTQAQPQTQTQKDDSTFNLMTPPSHCPGCLAPVKPWQNMPLISYALLRGKCSNCKAPISLRYPLVELATGLATAAIGWSFGWSTLTVVFIGFMWLSIALTMIDFDTQLLPDSLVFPLIWFGLLVNIFGVIVPLQDAVIGAMAGYLSLWSVYWAFKLITGKEGMGYGDFKLLAALGAWFGWLALPLIILLSALVGAVVGITLMLILGRDKNIPIPFGPYLCGAGWVYLFWGPQLMQWYLGSF